MEISSLNILYTFKKAVYYSRYSQVTVPRYKKYSTNGIEPTTLITFNMVCHGLSQNTQNHQLNSYRDVIMGKPYNEICDNLAVKMIFEPYAVYGKDRIVFKNGKMDVPYSPVPRNLLLNQISLDSEMVQTLVENCNITQVDIEREVSMKIKSIYCGVRNIQRFFHKLKLH